jgi:hypothetical protein
VWLQEVSELQSALSVAESALSEEQSKPKFVEDDGSKDELIRKAQTEVEMAVKERLLVQDELTATRRQKEDAEVEVQELEVRPC